MRYRDTLIPSLAIFQRWLRLSLHLSRGYLPDRDKVVLAKDYGLRIVSRGGIKALLGTQRQEALVRRNQRRSLQKEITKREIEPVRQIEGEVGERRRGLSGLENAAILAVSVLMFLHWTGPTAQHPAAGCKRQERRASERLKKMQHSRWAAVQSQ
jgi:hypothetical protein